MMKKIIILVFGIISLFLTSVNSYAASYRYEWNNTIIYIPVGDSIDDYKLIPTATLFVNNEKVESKLHYNREGDWMYYLSNVDTSRIGEYKVWYKVYEYDKYKPGTCSGYKCLISFIVIDEIKPEIRIFDDVLEVERGSVIDYLSNVSVIDNYDLELDVRAIGNANFNVDGEYEIKINAIDSSGNSSQRSYVIRVYSEAPLISCVSNSELIFNLGEEVDLSLYFKAYDKIDGDISSYISYPIIDTSKVVNNQTYYVHLSYNGFLVEKEFSVSIIDDEPPVLELSEDLIILNYKTDFEMFDFASYISKLEDNNEINYSNLVIEHNLENKVGQYKIIYSYTDGIFSVVDELKVNLISYSTPELTVSNVDVNVGEYIDLYEYVSVYDESDPNVMESLDIDTSEVDFNNPGLYYADVYVINSSGESVIKKIKIQVHDDSKDEIFDNNIIYISVIGVLVIVLIVVCIRRKKKDG